MPKPSFSRNSFSNFFLACDDDDINSQKRVVIECHLKLDTYVNVKCKSYFSNIHKYILNCLAYLMNLLQLLGMCLLLINFVMLHFGA